MSGHLRSERRRVALAEAVARAWDEDSVPYAVVHGLEDYPGAIGRDLDVALQREDVPTAVRNAVATARDHGFGTAFFRWSHWGLYQLALVDPDDSIALALDLLCTTRVWRAKWVQFADESLLDRVVAGDGRVGPFAVSREGRVLKSCVRPILCRDFSRLGEGREWPLPLEDDELVRSKLETVLEGAQLEALRNATSGAEVEQALPGAAWRIQSGWIRSHPVSALRSVGDAIRGRLLRRWLNPAACLFVATPDTVAAYEAAQDLAEQAGAMFIEVRPAIAPRASLARLCEEVTAWRAPAISEFVTAVVITDVSHPRQPVASFQRLLPTETLTLSGDLARDEVAARLRASVVGLLARSYSVRPFLARHTGGRSLGETAPVLRDCEVARP